VTIFRHHNDVCVAVDTLGAEQCVRADIPRPLSIHNLDLLHTIVKELCHQHAVTTRTYAHSTHRKMKLALATPWAANAADQYSISQRVHV
jgi:hypothetical protein